MNKSVHISREVATRNEPLLLLPTPP